MIGGNNTFSGIPDVVKNLLIINVLVFIAQFALTSSGFNFVEYFALFHWSSELFKPHQFITYMFLHADIAHIGFNMFGLWMFGSILERQWGAKKFLIFYIITGLGSALLYMLSKEIQIQYYASQIDPDLLNEVKSLGIDLYSQNMGFINPTAQKINNLINFPMLGASGAIFGLLMGFGYLFPNARLMLIFPPIPIKGKYIAVFALVLGIFMDVQGNVAHLAHLGGMVTAFILLKIWNIKSNNFA